MTNFTNSAFLKKANPSTRATVLLGTPPDVSKAFDTLRNQTPKASTQTYRYILYITIKDKAWLYKNVTATDALRIQTRLRKQSYSLYTYDAETKVSQLRVHQLKRRIENRI